MGVREMSARIAERFGAGRFCRSTKGNVAVEAAFVFPAVLIVIMIVLELAHMALTIQFSEMALTSALTRFRADGTLGPGADSEIRAHMAGDSHGLLKQTNITRVTVTQYDSLDAMGNPGGKGSGGGADEKEGDDVDNDLLDRYPAWHVVVVIEKPFITPLPRLLLTKRKDFTYRYERVLSYLPEPEKGQL